MLDSFPTSATRQTISCTGHGNVIQAAGGSAKTIILQANATVSGASLTANAQPVLIGVGSDPGTSTDFNGFILGPGEQMVLALSDTGSLYFRGASGDKIFITALY